MTGAVLIWGFLAFIVIAAAVQSWRQVQLERWARRRARAELRPRRWHS